MIRLYRAPYSTNVERVALALAHKGLQAESVWIDYGDRSEVERVSGQGLVPVIDDGGTVVADSTTILEYLEGRCPERPLYPADPARREETRVFIDWFDEVWKQWPNGIEADPSRTGELAARMAAALDRFEALLAGRPYLMGGDVSAADFVAFPFLKYATFRDPEDDELFHRILDEQQSLTDAHPRLAGWIERVNALPRV
ncbi:MAG TPA: glutathione S-transferase family protein [Thermoleophilaceae bacterium]